jgi:hypothetical protein
MRAESIYVTKGASLSKDETAPNIPPPKSVLPENVCMKKCVSGEVKIVSQKRRGKKSSNRARIKEAMLQ